MTPAPAWATHSARHSLTGDHWTEHRTELQAGGCVIELVRLVFDDGESDQAVTIQGDLPAEPAGLHAVADVVRQIARMLQEEGSALK